MYWVDIEKKCTQQDRGLFHRKKVIFIASESARVAARLGRPKIRLATARRAGRAAGHGHCQWHAGYQVTVDGPGGPATVTVTVALPA